MFNKSIHFSCDSCTVIIAKENHIDESYRKKSFGRKKPANKETSDEAPVTADAPADTPDPADNLADAIEKLSVLDTDVTDKEPVTVDLVSETSEEEISSPRLEKAESAKKVSFQSTTCTFYKQNICKFGISGKGCQFFHPKMCQRLLSNGNNNRKGCNKDGKCNYFHPPMCRNSLNKRLCTNLDCSYMHIRGTKRFQQPPAQDARQTLNRLASSKNTRKDGNDQKSSNRMENTQARKEPPQQSKDVPFLEMSPASIKPPAGNGYGGETNQLLMDLLQQLITLQSKQLQLQNQQQQQIQPQMMLQTQLPVIQQQRTLHM